MNRHTKLALLIAPLLIVIGYIASDIFIEQEAQKTRLFTMTPDGICDVLAKKCVLVSDKFKISVYDKDGFTTINSTFPLDSATLILVDANENNTAYRLGMGETPYYWRRQTELRDNAAKVGSIQKIRLVVNIKGGRYISEFYSETLEW